MPSPVPARRPGPARRRGASGPSSAVPRRMTAGRVLTVPEAGRPGTGPSLAPRARTRVDPAQPEVRVSRALAASALLLPAGAAGLLSRPRPGSAGQVSVRLPPLGGGEHGGRDRSPLVRIGSRAGAGGHGERARPSAGGDRSRKNGLGGRCRRLAQVRGVRGRSGAGQRGLTVVVAVTAGETCGQGDHGLPQGPAGRRHYPRDMSQNW